MASVVVIDVTEAQETGGMMEGMVGVSYINAFQKLIFMNAAEHS